MEEFETTTKKWGNSLGIILPKEIVREEHIRPREKITVLIIKEREAKLKKAFGRIKLKKPTQQVMDEIDEGYD